MRFLRDEHGTRIRHSLTKSTSGTSLVGGFAEMLASLHMFQKFLQVQGAMHM